MLDTAPALIFLLLASSSSCFELDIEDPEKIEAALIKARLSFLFFSNLEENLTCAAAQASSLVDGRSRKPRPNFLEAASSSVTLFL